MTRKRQRKKKKKQQPYGICLQQARHLAERHLYPEIKHDENNQVVSFQDGSVHIHVYYNTAAVILNFHHPIRGNGQIFRRKVTIEQLEEIISDPWNQLSKGYYCRNQMGQQWKWCHSSSAVSYMSDMARRWQYVAIAVDLMDGNKNTLSKLKTTMNVISGLLWDSTGKMIPSLDLCKYSCGSRSGMTTFILDIARLDGAVGVCTVRDFERLQVHGSFPEMVDLTCGSQCIKQEAFQETNQVEISQAIVMLRSFPRTIRKEVCRWLIGLLHCGYMIVYPDFDIDCYAKVIAAHRTYSKTFYPKDQLSEMCYVHGILATSESK